MFPIIFYYYPQCKWRVEILSWPTVLDKSYSNSNIKNPIISHFIALLLVPLDVPFLTSPSHIAKTYKISGQVSQIRPAIVRFRQCHHETEAINHHSLPEENSHFTLIIINSWNLIPIRVDGESIKLMAYCKILQPKISRKGYPALLSDSNKFQLPCHILPYSMLFNINFLMWNVWLSFSIIYAILLAHSAA